MTSLWLTADKKEGEVTTQLKEVMFAQGRREMADDAGRRVQASGYGNASAGIISVGAWVMLILEA